MSDSSDRRDAYRALCETEPSIPLFSRAWWLDAAAGVGNWDVLLIEKGGKIDAALPFVRRKRLGLTILTVPNLTPALGPWLRPYKGKPAKTLAREKSLLTDLFDALPEHGLYQQNWNVERKNWQPLYWKGFEQSTGYTYRLEDLSDTDDIWRSMDQHTRRNITKAQKELGISVRLARTTTEFLSVADKTFERQGLKPSYSQEYVAGLVDAAKARNAVDLLVAVHADGNVHAGAMIVYDDNTAYYLMGGGDPEFRNSGAASLVLWEAILRSKERVSAFDFEGSMMEPIERFFRGFGGALTPYLRIHKARSVRGQLYLVAQKLKQQRRSKTAQAA